MVVVLVGDVLLGPDGREERVLHADQELLQYLTSTGSNWFDDELEELPAPDPRDPVSVERYLRCAARVVPKAKVGMNTVDCPCSCRFCRVNVQVDERLNRELRRFHFVDSPACRCEEKKCC